MSVPAIDLNTRNRGRAYEDVLLNAADLARRQASVNAAQGLRSTPAQGEAVRNYSPRTRLAIDMAREGDDIVLMPYQPTPTINPGRPRTRAIGYDPKTETMWIRFREDKKNPNGAVYEYYNVPYKHWKNVKRVVSPGKWMNRNLVDKYPYARTDI